MEAARKPLKLAIIGAGVSGLSAAWSLQFCKELSITIFEKSKGLSGRAATRRKDGFAWDHGANYFYSDKQELIDFIQKKLPTDDLVEIKKPLYTFDGKGKITPGDPKHNQQTKWNYKSGISNLGKLIFAQCEKRVECKKSVRVEKLVSIQHPDSEGLQAWRLYSTEKEDLGVYDAVLLTPPSPQIVDLITASVFNDKEFQSQLIQELQVAEYGKQVTVALAYQKKLSSDLEYYALINTDKDHDIAWLSVEDEKPGHVPQGKSLIIAQMASKWTEGSYDKQPEDLISEAREKAEKLMGISEKVSKDDLLFGDVQKWRFALPKKAADRSKLLPASKVGIFFAGDYLIGKGRVLDALNTGFDAAEEIKSKYSLKANL